MPAIPVGTKVRVKGTRLRTMREREEYKEACDRDAGRPRYPGLEGRVVGHLTEKDPWPVGQLPGDPLHEVRFNKKLHDGYWFEELEVVT